MREKKNWTPNTWWEGVTDKDEIYEACSNCSGKDEYVYDYDKS